MYRTIRRNLLASGLFFCFLIPFCGIFGWLRFEEKNIEKDMSALIGNTHADEVYVYLAFAVRDSSLLRWEHAGEFEYKQQMYDIAETITRTDSIIYKCVPDYRETRLKQFSRQFAARSAGHDPVPRPAIPVFQNYLKTLFIEKTPDYSFLTGTNTRTNPAFLPFFCTDANRLPATPPPELFVKTI